MAIKEPKIATTLLGQTYQKFWQGFNDVTHKDNAFSSEFRPHPYGSVRCYQDYSIGEPYNIVVHVNFKRHEIRVGAYFGNLDAYLLYSELLKGRIERTVGKPLVWTLHQTKGSAYLHDSADFDESHGWENAYKRLIDDMLLMKRAFNWIPPKPVNDLDDEDD